VQLPDPREQPLVFNCPLGPAAAGALVIRRRRHAQGQADRLDPEATAMLIDVAAHFGRSGSSSLAKNTDADFKISFARRSSKANYLSPAGDTAIPEKSSALRKVTTGAVDLLSEARASGSRTASLHGAVVDLHDLERGIDLGFDANELTLARGARSTRADQPAVPLAYESMESAYSTAASRDIASPSARATAASAAVS